MIDMGSLKDIEQQAIKEGVVTPEQFLYRVMQLVAMRKKSEKLHHIRSRTGYMKVQIG